MQATPVGATPPARAGACCDGQAGRTIHLHASRFGRRQKGGVGRGDGRGGTRSHPAARPRKRHPCIKGNHDIQPKWRQWPGPARRGGPGREDARMHGLSAGSGPPTTHHRTTHHRGALSVGLPTGCNHVYMCHNTLAGSATVTRMEKEGEVCDKRTNLRNSGLNLSRS